jgi:hypothetical protein
MFHLVLQLINLFSFSHLCFAMLSGARSCVGHVGGRALGFVRIFAGGIVIQHYFHEIRCQSERHEMRTSDKNCVFFCTLCISNRDGNESLENCVVRTPSWFSGNNKLFSLAKVHYCAGMVLNF